MSNVDDVVLGDLRLNGHMFCNVVSFHMRPISLGGRKNEIPGFAVCMVAEQGPDPKVYFTDSEKASKFYDAMTDALMSGAAAAEIDVLEYGAL
jgi:hypothetical protein